MSILGDLTKTLSTLGALEKRTEDVLSSVRALDSKVDDIAHRVTKLESNHDHLRDNVRNQIMADIKAEMVRVQLASELLEAKMLR